MKTYKKPDMDVVSVHSEERVAVCPTSPVKKEDITMVPGLDGYGYVYDSPSHGVAGCKGTLYYVNAIFS